MRYLYTLLLYLLVPWIVLRLLWRSLREPGYRQYLGERFGTYRKIPGAPLVWVHAVSVGETRAAQPLIESLLRDYPHYFVLLTHMTPTGRDAGRELFGGRVERCYLPYDLPGAVAEFLDHYRPHAGILMETEIWPNLIQASRRRSLPLYLVNARLSARSWAGYRRVAGLTRRSLAGISVIAAQTQEDAERFTRLGAKNVVVTGSVKFDVTPPPAQIELAQTLRRLYGEGRPVLLAASTREGEEEMILDELDNIEVPSVLTVIVPRHPRRFAAVAGLIEQRGIKFQKRSAQEPIAPDTRIVLGDSMGEMFAYYGACDVAFIGGSLRPFGAHNLIEACAMGKPVLIGPSIYNFPEPVRHAVAAGVAIQVRNARALSQEATRLLLDPASAKRMGRDAAALCEAHRGATARIMELIRLVPGR